MCTYVCVFGKRSCGLSEKAGGCTVALGQLACLRAGVEGRSWVPAAPTVSKAVYALFSPTRSVTQRWRTGCVFCGLLVMPHRSKTLVSALPLP